MRVALTFDDGPSEWTGPLLDVLAGGGVLATFFVLGCHVDTEEGRRLVRRAFQAGHEIGNHGWSHARYTEMTRDEIVLELGPTRLAIRRADARAGRHWRPPYHGSCREAEVAAASLGLGPPSRVDVDTPDWKLDADAIELYVRAALLERHEDVVVVGLHDGRPPDGGTGRPDRAATVEAVRRLLADPEPDWQFVTVDGRR